MAFSRPERRAGGRHVAAPADPPTLQSRSNAHPPARILPLTDDMRRRPAVTEALTARRLPLAYDEPRPSAVAARSLGGRDRGEGILEEK